MSVKVMSWVFEHSQTVLNHRIVALALADWAHDDGRCWPGLEGLARKARCTTRTVMRATARMVELGELTITDRGNRTNLYQFTFCSDNLSPHDASREVTNPPAVVTPVSPCSDMGVTQSVRDPLENRQSARARRARRMPSEVLLTPERLAFATGEGLTRIGAEREWAKMADHEFQAPRSDWDAVWRNWVREAVRRAKPHGAPVIAHRASGSAEYRIRQGL